MGAHNNDGDPLDRFFPPVLKRLKESAAIGEEADVVLMLSRRLSAPLSKEDQALVRMGAKSEQDFAEPGVMQVTCRKHRIKDKALDRSVRLTVSGGKVGNYVKPYHGEVPEWAS